MLCGYEISNHQEENYTFNSISVNDFEYGAKTTDTSINRGMEPTNISANSSLRGQFEYKIGLGPYRWLYILFEFSNQDGQHFGEITETKEYAPITEEMYGSKQNERMTIFLLLISIGLFSIFSMVSNLKNIIEKTIPG